jgi:hypothetical protein
MRKRQPQKIAKRQSSPMSRANRVSLLHDSRSLISRNYGTVCHLDARASAASDFVTLLPSIERDQKTKTKTKNKMECDDTMKRGDVRQ